MFGSQKKKAPRLSVDKFSSLLANNITVTGDVEFEEGIKINGLVKGNVSYKKGSVGSLLALSHDGHIDGDVKSYDALINGTIVGNVYVEHLLELHANARITGDIAYRQLKMENGASVDGKLTKLDDDAPQGTVFELPAPKKFGD